VVRIIVEPVEAVGPEYRAAALERLKSGIDRMNFVSVGSYPTRDELHDGV
jgi:hypothetical protein